MSWDGRMYEKYRVAHTDGTPLKGKSYFVLRLDSDKPEEAARVNAAMRVYTGRLRQCDVGTPAEQAERWQAFCNKYDYDCTGCPCYGHTGSLVRCFTEWAQLPYVEEQKGDK